MNRKLIVIPILFLIAIAVGVSIWTPSVQGRGVDRSEDAQAVREVIQRAWRIQLEAEYTFDANQFAAVYINDPRGGEIPSEALDLIREVRRDPSVRADQVGILDYEIVAIENLKRNYENYIAELQDKKAAGTLTDEERQILYGETEGWPTSQPSDENSIALATQACELFIANVTLQAPVDGQVRAYPEPKLEYDLVSCPTSTPKPKIWVHHRGTNPLLLPAESFDIHIESIEIEESVAKAIVQIGTVTSEYVLVKVDGQWFIAGSRLLKFAP